MIKRLLILLILLILSLLLIAVPCWGANYTITDIEHTVDGGANESGRGRCNAGYESYAAGPWGVCTSADTIIIEGGARGDLKFENFDGVDDYITITNEDSTRVVITDSGEETGTGILILNACNYVDLRGDGLSTNDWVTNCVDASCYGIKVIAGSYQTNAGVRVKGESSNIKIGYIEYDGTNGGGLQVGIRVQDGTGLDNDYTFDRFEIHHNYIHDTQYSGMYLGHNCPLLNCTDAVDNDPYVSNFSIYDNLLEDMGSYGFSYKGIAAGSTENYIYNNTIKNTGLVYVGEDYVKIGIGLSYFFAGSYASVYNNWIEKTIGPGLYIRGADHLVYNNTIVGCGTGDDENWGHGIVITEYDTMDGETRDGVVQIYDNIIVEPTRYGVFSRQTVAEGLMARNIITEAGLGEWLNKYDPGLVEGSGSSCSSARGTLTTCPNVYQADTDSICFTTWSDDSDYSNDDFTLCCDYNYTSIAANACGATTTPFSGVAGDFKYN